MTLSVGVHFNVKNNMDISICSKLLHRSLHTVGGFHYKPYITCLLNYIFYINVIFPHYNDLKIRGWTGVMPMMYISSLCVQVNLPATPSPLTSEFIVYTRSYTYALLW